MDAANDFDDISEPVTESPLGKKRKSNKENYPREIKKRQRHDGHGKDGRISCDHQNSKMCQAAHVTPEVIDFNRKLFYTTTNKVKQDENILRLVDISKVKRTRVKDDSRLHNRGVSVRYFLLTKLPGEKILVCRKTFLSILGLSNSRCSRVIKYFCDNGIPRPELRGGAQNVAVYTAKKNLIAQHITSFTCRASHYARRGAPGRKYLPSDLSVKKMYSLFEEQNQDQISYALYYSVFSYRFNLGFGHPAKDICSECVKFRLKLKDPDLSDIDKKQQTAMFMLHRRRSRVFYDILNDVQDSISVCFDVMENLVLPKTPIGQSYYSRQLYLYVFGVVVHHGQNSHQSKSDIHLYVWGEQSNHKDSNMIASALSHCFLKQIRHLIQVSPKLRLFSDSCYGQNKNMNIVSMLVALRRKYFPKVKIHYTFPVRGHSFLPADRVFGRIEQDIRKKETILLPKEYYSILRNHGQVFVYGEEWKAFDFKAATADCLKTPRPFKISQAKVLEIDGDQVSFKSTYNAAFSTHAILKRGKSWKDFNPPFLSPCSTVSIAKKADVLKLLDEIGASDSVRAFYDNAFSHPENRSDVDNDDDDDDDIQDIE